MNKNNPTIDELIEELEKQKKQIDEELALLKRARGRMVPLKGFCAEKSEVGANLSTKNTIEEIAKTVLSQNPSTPLSTSEIAKKAVEMGIWKAKNPVQIMSSTLRRAEKKEIPWLGINRGEKHGTTRYFLRKEAATEN